MIVVDSSALVAIAGDEAEAEVFAAVLGTADAIRLSPINYVETAMVLLSRKVVPNRDRLDLWLSEAGVTVSDDLPLSSLALDAFLRFGKGNHPARLNLGDCFAYALAKRLDAPLLYKGDDFAQTDIRSAL
ncbi:type II toxin-antitoxin system VapC family toxin [Phenylobacterium sp.]|uniref:type II toxin-antitoxin system VapC family toxin n=1 Tax=Phenylobacterium sp. TaxID=1871053 RepID=UPI0025F6EED2|nr:type II toxin-antitoxin system VapC family toxin [Phenylobacterium sp.]MBX3485815.1 type II toxin-antitoxin system VapC family toxin [Phenylobacterium sp.]MCW5760766.1 type II toxin-antitoxin system VapC family toxin [Phenylobacterium sp.]